MIWKPSLSRSVRVEILKIGTLGYTDYANTTGDRKKIKSFAEKKMKNQNTERNEILDGLDGMGMDDENGKNEYARGFNNAVYLIKQQIASRSLSEHEPYCTDGEGKVRFNTCICK